MIMAVGKNSIKRAAAATGNEKESAVKKPAAKKAAKAVTEAAVAEEKPAEAVIAAPAPEVAKLSEGKLYDEQADGVNAHYGLNTPLPTFLL